MADTVYKISVVIPGYNVERYIKRAIDSVLAQTCPAHEIIVVDDGSTDNTAEIIKTYGSKIRCIYQKNAGVSVARNTGIEAATGDWIAFLDADDEWLPQRLAAQTEHLRRNPDLKWTFANFCYHKKEWPEFRPAHPDRPEHEREYFDDYLVCFTKSFFVSILTVLIHKTVFEKVDLFVPGMKRSEDTDLWFRIGYEFPKVGYLEKPLAIYHLNIKGSATKIHDAPDFLIDLIARHSELSKKFNKYDEFNRCASILVENRIRSFLKQKRYDDSRVLLKNLAPYLKNRFRREVRFRLIWPAVLSPMTDAWLWIKNHLKNCFCIPNTKKPFS